ncbi:hypothetical protein D9756_005761 [Leucocoprinus leucothites]|uniref:Thioester reductase (TE) domain-containing protein n=1 Tax=Leucocoprinus leucothites TaxID=201217 RepID=A0A8H5CME0_9AGAR|nr:hypothetical protein D9756_011509 [Leucoagaricus leucothites]KAF5354789.1 hypothetical protein D9756_005761 [Leucoagaricus leucothites]
MHRSVSVNGGASRSTVTAPNWLNSFDFYRGKPGILEQILSDMAKEVTHIVYIAWHLHFKLNLLPYISHTSGTRSLLDLALSSKRAKPPAHLHVVYNASYYFTHPCKYGYVKWIVEKIVESAMDQFAGFRAFIIRSGQISGASRIEAWSRKEFMHSILKVSCDLGMARKTYKYPINSMIAAYIYCLTSRYGGYLRTNGILQLGKCGPMSWSRVTSTLSRGSKNKNATLATRDEWIYEYPRMGRLQHSFIDHYLGIKNLPTLDTTKAQQTAGELVDFELTDEFWFVC